MSRVCRSTSHQSLGVCILFALILNLLRSLQITPSFNIPVSLQTSPSIPKTDEFHNVTILKEQAQEAWLNGSGYLWLQHSRKAGGTSLCMMLRDNEMGLVRMNQTIINLKRKTCQIEDFCFNCNVKDKYNTSDLERATIAAIQRNERNMIEMEGAGVPVDMLSPGKWGSFVFVSSIRHPIPRALSSLLHDGKTKCNAASNRSECMSHHLQMNETMMRCSRWIYNCHSNYYVRMFSGLDTQYTTDEDMLARAKQNFHRFSCVLLQERWDDTSVCLRRLGMFRLSKMQYNVNGGLDVDGNVKSDVDLSFLSKEDQERLWEMNRVDVEFYEWASDQVLSTLHV